MLMVSERWFPSVGGGEYHLLHLTRGLADRRLEVDLVTRDLEGTVTPEGADGWDGLRVYRQGPRTEFENPLGRALYPWNLIRQCGRLEAPDLIHVHCPLGSFPAVFLSRRLGVPLVRTLHGVYRGRWSAMLGPGPRAAMFSALEALSLSLRYDAVISVDGEAPSGLEDHPRVSWIPNGVDIRKFDATPATKGGSFTFLFVGRLVPQKGVVHLLEACQILEGAGLNFRLRLVGDGPERTSLESRARDLGLQETHFLGTVGEGRLLSLYKSADVFVLPSLWEGLPLTLLEAWASRLPVLATEVGGVRRAAKQDETARLVPPGDPQALAEGMRDLMADEGLRRRLGGKGRRMVEERFTWDRIVQETLGVYTECIGG